jgi:hypothetical protein
VLNLYQCEMLKYDQIHSFEIIGIYTYFTEVKLNVISLIFDPRVIEVLL